MFGASCCTALSEYIQEEVKTIDLLNSWRSDMRVDPTDSAGGRGVGREAQEVSRDLMSSAARKEE
jgi:hypothetical protein